MFRLCYKLFFVLFSYPDQGFSSFSDATGTGTTNGAILYNYTYDQLNRLKAMDAFKGLNASNNSWANIIALRNYRERISYDGNGNILTYSRYGNNNSQQLMDSLSYSYNYLSSGTLAGKLSNNRLRRVRDFMSNAAAYDESDVATGVSDLEDQTNADNYTYDEIGNLKSDAKENISLINWNVYGKITDINFNFIANKNKTIYYLYDAAGNRIGKQVEKYGATSGATTTSTYTWYVRDASGNVMATYNSSGTAATIPATLSLGERHLYGSSRLGLLALTADSKNLPQSAPTSVYSSNFIRGNKFFELSNHLGNVLVTVSDKKIGVDDGTYDPVTGVKTNSTPDSKIDYYNADVVTANDYYPFGMGMPGRKFAADNKYRYGFNGKENDNEVKGEGGQQDYGMRIYDPRIGKFLSVDPITLKYPFLTPYQFASNRAVDGIDLDGLEFIKKDNYNYRMDYYPVANAGSVMEGVKNGLNNVCSFLYNGTLGALLEGSKGINNYFAGGYKEPSVDLMRSFDNWQNSLYKYATTTPVKQQLKDLGNDLTDLRNYEMLPSLIIAHKFSFPSALSSSTSRLPLQGEIFTSSIATRGAAEKYAEMTSYKSYWNANDYIRVHNPAFDLISTIEKKVVDVATTSKTNLKISTWEKNKLKRLGELRPQGYSSTLQMYVKEGQYTAEQLANYKKSLDDYVSQQGLNKVSAEVTEISKK